MLNFILPHFFVQMLSSAFLQPLKSHIFTCFLRLTLERRLHTDLTVNLVDGRFKVKITLECICYQGCSNLILDYSITF
jgi:hypothetical protein